MSPISPSATSSSGQSAFQRAFASCPLVAILRGIQPAEAVEIGQALYEAGFRLLEVPLNSPQPLASIAALRRTLPAGVEVGAGTVLDIAAVAEVADAGGTLIVMPHSDAAVIQAAKREPRILRYGGRARARLTISVAAVRAQPPPGCTPRSFRRTRPPQKV